MRRAGGNAVRGHGSSASETAPKHATSLTTPSPYPPFPSLPREPRDDRASSTESRTACTPEQNGRGSTVAGVTSGAMESQPRASLSAATLPLKFLFCSWEADRTPHFFFFFFRRRHFSRHSSPHLLFGAASFGVRSPFETATTTQLRRRLAPLSPARGGGDPWLLVEYGQLAPPPPFSKRRGSLQTVGIPGSLAGWRGGKHGVLRPSSVVTRAAMMHRRVAALRRSGRTPVCSMCLRHN